MYHLFRLPVGLLLVLFMVSLVACNSASDEDAEPATTAAVQKIAVNILVVDDKKLGPVIQRQFSSRRDGQATITEMSWDDLEAAGFDETQKHDILIYPARRLGEFASRNLLIPISEENARLEENVGRSLLITDRDQIVRWGKEQVAMSMGQSHWVMLYRDDVLEALKTEPPTTWKEFDKLAVSIAEMDNSELPRQIGIPLQGHWASYSLFARVASAIRLPGKYSSYFDVSSMKPLIDSEPFLRSLQAWQNQVATDLGAKDPAGVIGDFVNGKLAVAMVPVNLHWLNGTGIETLPATRIGPVPGWESVFDEARNSWTEQLPGALLSVPYAGATGMMASASSGTRQQRNAIEVISWITGKQMSSVLSVESPTTGLSRKVHLANPQKWLGPLMDADNSTRFADYLTRLNNGRRVLISLRIPGSDSFLNVLDEAVRQSVLENANAVESLSSAAASWSELVEEAGQEELKQSYRQSVGLGGL